MNMPRMGMDRGFLLVVDDEEHIADLVSAWLGRDGWRVDAVGTRKSLMETLEMSVPDVVLLDLNLPDGEGLSVLGELRMLYPTVPVVIVTATREVDVVVEAMRGGAVDYLAKPFDKQRLLTATTAAKERGQLHQRVRHLEEQLSRGSYRGIVGRSPAMERLYRELDHVTASDVSVLIHGESGTGKELVARALHDNGKRGKGPFVAINCAAIPESLVESELFGHERGAFTSAVAQHKGSIERASGGTLFLDEIGELPLAVQGKLLRVLQERVFQRVGGHAEIRSDFRLVSATHRDLREQIAAARFREDLYYRMAVFEIELPPLRERTGDIGLIANYLTRQVAPTAPPTISEAALAVLEGHSWPGNIRELRNAIERAAVVCGGGPILPEHLPPSLREPKSTPRVAANRQLPPAISVAALERGPSRAATTMDDIERDALVAALERCHGNVSAAVRELGIGRTTLYRKMKKFGLA